MQKALERLLEKVQKDNLAIPEDRPENGEVLTEQYVGLYDEEQKGNGRKKDKQDWEMRGEGWGPERSKRSQQQFDMRPY
jgi:hypothetical protein